jgi:2-polyprenyl-3-methyl-5-hydroxy-6-metoxy-1,4-benzoquinol methylase
LDEIIKICPLCKSEDIKLIELIKKLDLIKLYNEYYKINVKKYIKSNKLRYYKCNNCDLFFYTGSYSGDSYFYNQLYEKVNDYYESDKQEYYFAKKYINKNNSVLEVGCGNGSFYKLIKSKIYIGLELNKNIINKIKSNNINIRNETIEKYNEKNKNKFDIVCCFQVLEHINIHKIDQFLSSLVKKIKNNGYLIISVPSNDSFISMIRNNILNMPPHHFTHWKEKTLIKIAKNYDLKIINIYKDILNDKNKKIFFNIVLNSFFYKSRNICENNFINKTINKLLKIIPFSIIKYIILKIKPKGHSITVIYKNVN